MRMLKGSRGVTLIELSVGLAIVATLATLAMPGFRADLRTTAVRTAAYELLAGLQTARAGSIVEGRTGVLCLADPAGNCLATAADTAGVAEAWQVFLEVDGHPLLLAAHSLPAGVVLRSSRTRLKFWPDSLTASTGTLTICDSLRVARPRAIVLSQGGRARLTDPADSACG
jgi:prepilin-type N-terminal cleavage/methylation domain-containing protein